MILGETMMGEFMKKMFRESHKLLAEYRGLFDKTVGDQIVAIFGTPKDDSQPSDIHPFDAIACALEMMKAARTIDAQLQAAIQDNYSAVVARHKALSKEDRESVRIEDLCFRCRIGINTSNPVSDREIDRMRMVMMGAETCIDYTAQGGAVIYAFRLESSGVPGEIHIGENTKRAVEHVYRLEDMPPISLKGLGVQPRYRVVGFQSIFDCVFPKTRFYQTYRNNTPPMLRRLIREAAVGRIQIREVRKINEFIDINISYLEHIEGLFNATAARSMFAFAAADSLQFDKNRTLAVLFSAVWYNAETLFPSGTNHNGFVPYDVKGRIPEGIDEALVFQILDDIRKDAPELKESRVILMTRRFDEAAFDRTYRRSRVQEIVSAKEAVSALKREGTFEPELLGILTDLFIVPDAVGKPVAEEDDDALAMPRDPDRLIKAIQTAFTTREIQTIVECLTPRCPVPSKTEPDDGN
jgi:class 3 adenylate cyclase